MAITEVYGHFTDCKFACEYAEVDYGAYFQVNLHFNKL